MTGRIRQITTIGELREYLQHQEMQRIAAFTFKVGAALQKSCSPAALHGLALDMMPLTCYGAYTWRMQGNAMIYTLEMKYRSGVRMLDAWRKGRTGELTCEEQKALSLAEKIAKRISGRFNDPMDRLLLLFRSVPAIIRYRSAEPGSDEFLRLADGACALIDREGNCQGIAEAMYLIGGMLGFQLGMQNGMSRLGAHTWNTVVLDGCCYALDASCARLISTIDRSERTDYASFLMGRREAVELGLSWSRQTEMLALNPTLDPGHDFYCTRGYSVATLHEASRLAWRRRFAGDRETHIRIRSREEVTLDDVNAAICAAAQAPDVCLEMQRAGITRWSFRTYGRDGRTAFVIVEWDEP